MGTHKLQGADQKTNKAALKAIARVHMNALREAFLLMDGKWISESRVCSSTMRVVPA